MSESYQKEYRDNITDEQEQKRREAIRQYQKKYRDMTNEQKQKRREANRRHQKKYRDNMSDEQKQKQKDYLIGYRKKCYAAKKLNKIINDNKINDNKTNDDNDNDNDSDFYCISIIIKLKNAVTIKDINSILKFNKKVCSQVYLGECDFINKSD